MSRTTAIEATVIAIGAALLLVSAAAAAETFRWIDADGGVHYSDRPVQGAEQVQIRTPEVGGPGAAPDQAAEDDDVVRAGQCALARKRLKDYETSDRLFQEDEFGRQTEIKGEDRVQLIASAQTDVESFCDGLPEVAETPAAATETKEAVTQESTTPGPDAEY